MLCACTDSDSDTLQMSQSQSFSDVRGEGYELTIDLSSSFSN